MTRSVSLLVTDLDNTLFDWVAAWYASFSALLEGISTISAIPIDVLIPEIRRVHQTHGTSEYAFLIQELPSLKEKYGNADLLALFSTPIEAFRDARRATLALYPGVMETISHIRNSGCLIVAYTESMAFYTNYRLRHLDLDLVLDFLYSPVDHELPRGVSSDRIRHYPAADYRLRHTIHRHTPKGEIKPNPTLLLEIVDGVGGQVPYTVYVGDSLMKDVAMAQRANICDVWAKYGTAQNRPEYKLLRDVTHWSAAQVEYERRLTRDEVRPTFTLEESYCELLALFDFVPFRPS